jgi:hypothetical protein
MPIPQSKVNEIEIDFSEDIKKMNKLKEIKVEEVLKIEAKPEEATNTAVTAPPEVKVDQA